MSVRWYLGATREPPGPELVRHLVSLIQTAEADDDAQVARPGRGVPSRLRSVRSMVRAPDAQRQIAAPMERGLQTREAELTFAHVLGDMPGR